MKNFTVAVLIGLFLLCGAFAIQAVPALGQMDRMEAAHEFSMLRSEGFRPRF